MWQSHATQLRLILYDAGYEGHHMFSFGAEFLWTTTVLLHLQLILVKSACFCFEYKTPQCVNLCEWPEALTDSHMNADGSPFSLNFLYMSRSSFLSGAQSSSVSKSVCLWVKQRQMAGYFLMETTQAPVDASFCCESPKQTSIVYTVDLDEWRYLHCTKLKSFQTWQNLLVNFTTLRLCCSTVFLCKLSTYD